MGLADRHDVFILSDTRDEAIATAEATGLLRLRLRLSDGPALYYRRRKANTDRKAGNIGDWVETHGAGYDFMLVLDADSLMSGETIAALTARRWSATRGSASRRPCPRWSTPRRRSRGCSSSPRGSTARCSPGAWPGGRARRATTGATTPSSACAAFAQSAGLPHLTGPKPFGGHILSHDFIEAALLRRRGWAVRTFADLPGSYEETPPTLLDTAARDRRWCQGNLQHARVLAAAGLHWVSRLHLVLRHLRLPRAAALAGAGGLRGDHLALAAPRTPARPTTTR